MISKQHKSTEKSSKPVPSTDYFSVQDLCPAKTIMDKLKSLPLIYDVLEKKTLKYKQGHRHEVQESL